MDTKIPKKFAPYGIQTITDADGTETIWVTYTALDKSQGGFVDSFTPAGVLKTHFAVSGPLHSPWGLALAPADFGPMSNALLITARRFEILPCARQTLRLNVEWFSTLSPGG